MQPVHIRHQLEQMLTNLGTDYLDIYYFHNANFGPNDQYLEDEARTMRELQKEGKVRVVGQSAYSFADFMRVCPVTRPEVLQFHYNAFGNQFDQKETNLFRWAEEQNLGMVLFRLPRGYCWISLIRNILRSSARGVYDRPIKRIQENVCWKSGASFSQSKNDSAVTSTILCG